MSKNAQLWAEENAVKQVQPTKSAELRTGGVTQAGITTDLDQFEEPVAPKTTEPGAQVPGATPGQPPIPGTTPTPGGNK